MGKKVVVTDKYFLSLDKIRSVEVSIDSSTIESSARHVLASPANHTVVKGKIVIFAVEFLYMSLHNRDSPAQGESVVGKHRQHILVPKILPLSALLLHGFEVGESYVGPIAEIEVVVDDCLAHPFNDFLVFGLVDRPVEELMLEGDVFDLLDAVDLLCI